MNTNITPKSPLFLSLSTLSEPCNVLHNLINDPNSSRKERVECEKNLWKRIQDIRELNEESLVTHFIGYYSKLLVQLSCKQATCDLLQYHIFIRLGDLNRYINQLKVAEIYYSNARNSFPLYGHAYNQLALLAGVKDIYRCCYYYARAAKSCEKPLKNIADSNLRIAVGKSDCELLDHILDNDLPIEDVMPSSDGSPISLPESASQWFYVMVVAIYSDNIQAIAKSYLHYMSENFATQKVTTVTSSNNKIQTIFCDKDSYLLLACLDILLDWLRLGSQGRQLVVIISASLRRIRSCLHATLLSMKLEPRLIEGEESAATTRWFSQSTTTNSKSNNTTHSSTGMTNDTSCSTLQDSSTATTHINSSSSSSDHAHRLSLAFPHDYVLRGFQPLECVHKQVAFGPTTKATHSNGPKLKSSQLFRDVHGPGQKFIESIQLMQLLSRIRLKIEALGPLLKKRSRNIALESILTNMANGD